MATVGTLQRLSAAALSDLVLAEQGTSNASLAIIDVRDDGEEGFHVLPTYGIAVPHLPMLTIAFIANV